MAAIAAASSSLVMTCLAGAGDCMSCEVNSSELCDVEWPTGVDCLVEGVEEVGSSLPSKRFDMAPLCHVGAVGG